MQVGILGIEPELLAAEAEQRIEEIAALLAKAGQQGMPHVQIPIIGTRGLICHGAVDARLLSRCARRARGLRELPGQLADVANLAPGFAARVEREDHHIDVPSQPVEHAQVMRWQAADAKHQQALGQSRQRFVAVQALQEVAEQARPVRVAVLRQLAPEQRLPGLVGPQTTRFAPFPGRQPVVAVEQVLVEGIGDLRRQGQAPAFIAAVQVLPEARCLRQVVRLAEPAIQAPGQGGRGKRRLLRQAAEHLAAQRPDEGGRQLQLELHGDALLARQREGQPAPHALTRDHHLRRGEGIGQRLGEQGRGQFTEGFQVGRVVEAEHGRSLVSRRLGYRAPAARASTQPLPGAAL